MIVVSEKGGRFISPSNESMKKYLIKCDVCGRKRSKKDPFNSTTIVRENELVTFCEDCYRGNPVVGNAEPGDKYRSRAAHWNEIRSRVRTPDGEVLSGNAGINYQKRYGKLISGKDMGNQPPITGDRVRYFEKTGK